MEEIENSLSKILVNKETDLETKLDQLREHKFTLLSKIDSVLDYCNKNDTINYQDHLRILLQIEIGEISHLEFNLTVLNEMVQKTDINR